MKVERAPIHLIIFVQVLNAWVSSCIDKVACCTCATQEICKLVLCRTLITNYLPIAAKDILETQELISTCFAWKYFIKVEQLSIKGILKQIKQVVTSLN